MSFALDLDLDPALSMLDARLVATRTGLRTTAQALAASLLAHARAKADGDVLQVHTGDYLRSLSTRIIDRGEYVAVRLSSDAPGAGLLEYGGEIPAHDIVPSAAQALRFMGDAGAVYAAVFHVPAFHVEPHPVMHAAFDEIRDEIVSDLEAVAKDGPS